MAVPAENLPEIEKAARAACPHGFLNYFLIGIFTNQIITR
jgi:hypothetical protein